MDIVLIEKNELIGLLQNLINQKWLGTIIDQPDLYQLLPEGEEELTHLLAAAKAHEADTLGTFTPDESHTLKALLKRLT